MARDKTVLLVGTGKMGFALLEGWSIEADYSIVAIDPVAPDFDELLGRQPIFYNSFNDYKHGFHQPAVIVFAVKPQTFPEVLSQYRDQVTDYQPLVISIAAGITVETIRNLTGAKAVVRAMPNLPATVGAGVSALLGVGCSKSQLKLAKDLMEAAGSVEWLEQESDFDAVTALSGSGPAYVFLLAEYMAEVGEELGLKPDIAARLAMNTVIGSGELLFQSEDGPTTLRKKVTSKGGTTAAALEVLMREGGLKQELRNALTAARDRSKELGKK